MEPPRDTCARLIRVREADNVATALCALSAGEEVQLGELGGDIIPLEDIPFCHKIAVRNIEQGAPIIKYGENIGFAVRPIPAGSLVHVHNMISGRARRAT
jgi:hypothetical protein